MGVNINGINKTNIIWIALYITYSILWLFPIPKVLLVSLASNLIGMITYRHFLMRGIQYCFCKRHILRTTLLFKDVICNVPDKTQLLED